MNIERMQNFDIVRIKVKYQKLNNETANISNYVPFTTKPDSHREQWPSKTSTNRTMTNRTEAKPRTGHISDRVNL